MHAGNLVSSQSPSSQVRSACTLRKVRALQSKSVKLFGFGANARRKAAVAGRASARSAKLRSMYLAACKRNKTKRHFEVCICSYAVESISVNCVKGSCSWVTSVTTTRRRQASIGLSCGEGSREMESPGKYHAPIVDTLKAKPCPSSRQSGDWTCRRDCD